MYDVVSVLPPQTRKNSHQAGERRKRDPRIDPKIDGVRRSHPHTAAPADGLQLQKQVRGWWGGVVLPPPPVSLLRVLW